MTLPVRMITPLLLALVRLAVGYNALSVIGPLMVRKFVSVASLGPLMWPPDVTLPSMVIGPDNVALTLPLVWSTPFCSGARAVRIVIGLGMFTPALRRTRVRFALPGSMNN